MHLRRYVLLAFAALLLSACATATLTGLAYRNAATAYSNLGPMLAWMADDYVELEGAREDWVRSRIDRTLAWHRAEELPRYRALLESMLAKSEAGFRVEDIGAHQLELRGAYQRLMGQVIPDTAEFLATVESEDVAHIERRFAEDNRRFVKESVRGTPEERRERRIGRFVMHLEAWVGDLESAQRDLVERHYRGLRDISEEFMGERRHRQTEVIALVKARPPRGEMEAGLRRLFVDVDSWRRPEFTAKVRERDARLHTLIAELSASLTPKQRGALQKRIRGFLRDIASLTGA